MFLLFVTDILDHDAQVGNMMVNSVLSTLRSDACVDWSALRHLLLVADCGPHFRSKENLAHFCVVLPKALQLSTEVCYLGEQHGKSGVDRCFGWCNRWITDYIRRLPVYGLDDLLQCFKQGASQMMREDPEGPTIHVLPFSPGPQRPSKRTYCVTDDFKISRTYSLVSTLSKHSDSGVRIQNKIFSDMKTGHALNFALREVVSEAAQPFRVGYYDKARTWEEMLPLPSIGRRYLEQKAAKSSKMPTPTPSFLDRCSDKALSICP